MEKQMVLTITNDEMSTMIHAIDLHREWLVKGLMIFKNVLIADDSTEEEIIEAHKQIISINNAISDNANLRAKFMTEWLAAWSLGK